MPWFLLAAAASGIHTWANSVSYSIPVIRVVHGRRDVAPAKVDLHGLLVVYCSNSKFKMVTVKQAVKSIKRVGPPYILGVVGVAEYSQITVPIKYTPSVSCLAYEFARN